MITEESSQQVTPLVEERGEPLAPRGTAEPTFSEHEARWLAWLDVVRALGLWIISVGLLAIVPVALMAATALLARAPIGTPAAGSELRVALSTAHGRIEICRTPGEQELAALPAHMRAQRICEETAPDYLLKKGRERLQQHLLRRDPITRLLHVALAVSTPIATATLSSHAPPLR